ncbi:MAG: electron transport complex subunit RsxA, partial [Clostridia bacterium]|nr:electron transport complex subunit RsxA [Clostridia bacterium]
MNVFTKILIEVLAASLVNNVVLSRFLGLCPFLGVSRKTSTAVGMGTSVTIVVTISSAVT